MKRDLKSLYFDELTQALHSLGEPASGQGRSLPGCPSGARRALER
jgi:hypothetical protein